MNELPAPAKPVDAATELVRLKRKLTPKQRRLLKALPLNKGQFWGTLDALGFGAATGHRWMRKPDFRRARELIEQQALDEIGVTHHRILAETAAIAFSDPRKMFDENGNLRPISELDDETVAAIASLEVDEEIEKGEDGKADTITRTSKIKRWDKHKALELLGRYRRMWGDDAPKAASPDGPGMTVVVHQGGNHVAVQAPVGAQGRVVVHLPEPE